LVIKNVNLGMEDLTNRIEINTDFVMGKPVIKGSRITVESIVAELGSGYSLEDVLQAHPRLQKEDIYAALQYASAIMKNEKIYTISS
jgi:uncharacterized protein (DUF433 family)